MKKIYVLYFILVAAISGGLVLFASGSFGNLWIFWDLPSFIITPLLALIILLGHFSPREMIGAFRCAWAADAGEPELKKALLFFESFHRLTIISSLFGFMLGVVLIFYAYPSEQFNSNFGKFMAICVLTIVYALFIVMTVTVPFQSAIRKKLLS
jgi:hypothetical protein